MIVIHTHHRTVVLTGWRAWVGAVIAMAIVWLVLAFLAFVLIGLAVTLAAALLLIIPAVLVVAALQSLSGTGRS